MIGDNSRADSTSAAAPPRMLWLLVFLAVAGTLAYRGVPLATATGVLGVTVLLYGWLGDSAGHFLLLLLAWALVFVPLNTAALRQEWFSRPLLDRWLAATAGQPTDLPAVGPAAVLLDGELPSLAPAAEITAPDASLRAEALAAALLQRLRTPLTPAQGEPLQAEVGGLLEAMTALQAQAPRLLAHEQPDSGELARAALAWPLAEACARLRGLAPDANLHWAAADPAARIAERLDAAHSGSRVLHAAAALPSPAARLLAFDAALWPLFGRLLGSLVRSLIDAIPTALPASADDGEEMGRDGCALAANRVATLVRLRVILRLAGRVPAAYDHALARAVLALLAMQATQSAAHGSVARPLREQLLRSQRHRLELALAAALREWPQPALRHLLRALVLPLPLARPPTEAEGRAAGTVLLREPAVRARLAAGLPEAAALQALETRIEALRGVDPALRRLQRAQFEPPPADEAARVNAAERLGLLSAEEAATLYDALAFAAGIDTSIAKDARA